MSTKKQFDSDDVQISLRISLGTKKALKEVARGQRRSLAAQARLYIEERLSALKQSGQIQQPQ